MVERIAEGGGCIFAGKEQGFFFTQGLNRLRGDLVAVLGRGVGVLGTRDDHRATDAAAILRPHAHRSACRPGLTPGLALEIAGPNQPFVPSR